MKGQVYHVEVNVSNIDKSVKFYDGFMDRLGYHRIYTHKIAAGWGLKDAPLLANFWIIQSHTGFTEKGFHRKRVGVNHIAFHANSRNDVDQLYKEYLLPNKIPVLYGGPKEYPEYSKGYYAVYFEDPDRLKLELAHIPGAESSSKKA